MQSSATSLPLRPYSALHPYQVEAINFAYEHDASLIQARMGAGKHAIGATVIQELINDGVLKRVLVVTTPRVMKHVWATEWQLWEHLSEPAIADGSPGYRSKVIRSDAPIVVMSLGTLQWAAKTFDLPALFQGLLIDETTKVKAPAGKRAKAMEKQLPRFKWRCGLTGTLGGDGKIEELFGQVRWFSDVLGRNITAFRQRYMILISSEYNKWGARPGAWEEVVALTKRLLFQVDDAAYRASLPPVVPTVVPVELPPDIARMYRKLERDQVFEDIVVDSLGVLTGKLHQIADGLIYADEPRILHTQKINALIDLVSKADGPVLIAYTYTTQLEMAQAALPGPVMGAGKSFDTDAWNRGEIPVAYIHPRSAAHGLNLQTGGNTIIFLSVDWSRDDHEQLIARLARGGQKEEQVWAYYILAGDTIDMDIPDRILEKQAQEAWLLEQVA